MNTTGIILQELHNYFQRIGFMCEIIAPNQTTPFPILVVRLEVFSTHKPYTDFQLYFLPNKFPEFNILQTFTELSNPIEDQYIDEVKKSVRKLNFISTVGSYGISDSKSLYYKHGNVIPISMDAVNIVKMIDQQTGVLFHQIRTHLDQLLDVVEGKQLNSEMFLNSPDF